MPYVWVPSDLFCSYAGVNFYRVYEDDNAERGECPFCYGWSPDCSDAQSRYVFDAREIAAALGLSPPDGPEGVEPVLRAAVDAGIFTSEGPFGGRLECPRCGAPAEVIRLRLAGTGHPALACVVDCDACSDVLTVYRDAPQASHREV